ncbi:hypothetical protein Q5P01_010911 [Channa striata]|uniref:Neural cell adhesion molecule 1-like n=1 Tax=Channa striata TaxID=64152 RepID=A0AA88MWH1_CHASR|nr:hypothetical protein Q5P01_010911 [Channa striata]
MNQSALLKLTLLLSLLVYSTDAKMDIIMSKQDVVIGEEILMLCKAGGEGEITWKKDGEDIDDEIVSVVDETSSKLHIKKAKLQDAGKYTCLCEFESGYHDDTQIVLFVYEGPSFGSTKTYHEFLEGTDGVVPCLAMGQPEVDVHWFREKQEIPLNEGRRIRRLHDNTLRIENIKRDDAGTYVCQAQIRGRSIYQQLSVSVVKTMFTLLCLVDGLPKPNITWTMPVVFDPSHHRFNSDRSQLTIRSVARPDFGEYVCTATNKIAENSAVMMLHVFEAPEVFVSAEQQRVFVGERVSVSCNASGHPQPELQWLNKHTGNKLDSASGRVRVVDSVLVIDEVVPSDGGLYSCRAVSASGIVSRDVAIHTQPGPPQSLTVSPGPASVLISVKAPPVSGGTPITGFVLQWRQSASEEWKQVTVPASDPLTIPSLKPYTLYTVRLAARNAVGPGNFSDITSVRTQGINEPDSPVLLVDGMKIEGNSFSIPLKQVDDGGVPLLYFNVRYRQDKEQAEWKEMQLASNADSVFLQDLAFDTDYQLEITAVNANGSSIPAAFNFTIAEQPFNTSSGITKGSVVGIVMVIFLVVFLVVDATCCYRNRCGLLMSIAVKLFGQKVPGMKMLEEGDGTTNGEVTLKGMSTPRGSMQQTGVQTVTKAGEQLKEVTCDKAPLTKNEKTQP